MSDPMCVCGAPLSFHEHKNPPWTKPGKGARWCHVPMCSCIDFQEEPEDFFEEDECINFTTEIA